MITKGETKSGFVFEIETSALDNMEFMDAVAEIDGGNPLAISKVINLMLGKQKEKLYNHLRLDDGRVPIEAVSDEVIEIFGLLNGKEKK